MLHKLTITLVTTTVYPTTDVTSTSTVTYISASSTTYAACATDNMVSSANGDSSITFEGGIGTDSVGYSEVSGINDSYDCCVACQTFTGDCGGYLYATGFCELITYTTCSPTTANAEFETEGPADGDGFTVGNGPCGQIVDGGAE